MSALRALFLTTALATGAAGAASAATVDLAYQGSTVWGTPAWAESATIKVDGVSSSVGAGLMRLKNSVTGAPVLAFCVDVYNTLTNPPGAYTEKTSLFSAAVTARVQALFDTAYASVNSAARAAGFQMALWEIVTEKTGSLSLSSGSFAVTGSAAAVSQANAYLAGLTGAATQAYTLTYLDSLSTRAGLGQDLVTMAPAPVPLPASVLLLGGAVAGLGAAARRRRKAA